MSTRTLLLRLECDEIDPARVQVFAVDGEEAIGRLFQFEVRVVYLDPAGLDPEALVGADAALVFELDDPASGEPPEIHRVHGMLAEVEDMLDPEAEVRTYRLRLVPRAYRATLVETQEIFLGKSIPEIIRIKLSRLGLGDDDVAFRLLGEYPPREFVVQYKETDHAFISRLSEHLGISYAFEHKSGRDVIVFSDDNTMLAPIEGAEAVTFRPRGEPDEVHRISSTARLIPATQVVQDYNYLTPEVDLTGRHEIATGYAGGVIEYGSNYWTPAEGAALARLRAEEKAATNNVLTGASAVHRFHAGETFTLDGHPKLDPTRLVLIEVEHRARQNVALHSGEAGERSYANTFRAIDAAVPYRPPRRTPRPVLAGVISARVEPHPDGDIGKHAEIDEQGRYTVRFFFDPSPLGARERSTLPVRMAQPHAGPNYGFHFPLKPGIEVLIAFAEGDLDRPFIVASVPNPITPSPVTRQNSLFNKIETVSGIFMEMKDV